MQAEALAYLADLRLAQGQVEEARRLLAGFEHHLVVAPVLAAAWLAGGNAAVAVSTVLRSLDQVGGRHLEAARLRDVLGEARLALGEPDGAAVQGQRLVDLGARLGCELMVARGERLVGRALLAGPGSPGAGPQASPHLERALVAFSLLEMPLEAGRTRMLLAQAVHAEAPEVAVAEARAALTLFEVSVPPVTPMPPPAGSGRRAPRPLERAPGV